MSRNITFKSDKVTAILTSMLLLVLTGCGTRIEKDNTKSLAISNNQLILPDSNFIDKIDISIPPSTLDLLACIKCHKGLKVITKRRVLKGTHLDFAFDHPGFNSENKWCYSCHYPFALDVLRLESGKLVSYQKSYEQCIQCHIANYNDWAVGLHGRRTGMWNGDKQYLSCVSCHNPHTPKFKPFESKKPPLRPI